MKKLLFIIVAGIAFYAFLQHSSKSLSIDSFFGSAISTSDQAIGNAFQDRQSDLQVGGAGTVTRLLPDDTQGSRHQKFIIMLSSGQTLLVAHNIDIAPRIGGLAVGDHINFYGEYEWNAKGGMVHWTHRDPSGHHADGWINHGGKLYQ